MLCRAHRLLITGFIGAAVAAVATMPANAGEITVQQAQTIAIPKRQDSAQPANLTTQPVTLGGLKAGGALSLGAGAPLPPSPSSAGTSPLSGLSLENLSLAPPANSPEANASLSGDSAVTAQHGNIRYSVIPDSGFTPYIGLGTGRAAGMLGSGQSHADSSDDGLHSYQGVAGFAYKIDKDTRLDFDYRMSNTQRPNVPMLDNANVADSERDRAAILSFHYDLDPILRQPK